MTKSQQDELEAFVFAIPMTLDNEAFLRDQGYERRSGSCTYTHKFFEVRPFKKWYYPVESFYGIKLSVTEEVITKHKLKVEYPKS